MDIFVLDKNLMAKELIDSYESLIWTERYNEAGDFELCTLVDPRYLTWLRSGYYLWRKDSDVTMFIEKVQITSDAESGSRIICTGRSLEALLDRRIVWSQTLLNGNFQTGIKKLIDDAFINPQASFRKVDNFIFETSTDPIVTSLKIDTQFTGDNLYEAVSTLCKANGVGFKLYISEEKNFVFKLYAGTDRSYKQDTNPYVIFSPNFENLINSDYTESYEELKDINLVMGEGEGAARIKKMVVGPNGSGKGFDRREMYTDARDLTRSNEDGTEMSVDDYTKLLEARGLEKLTEQQIIMEFQGEVDTVKSFIYGKDFFMGDIVQIKNEWNIEARCRVVELVRSHEQDGYTVYPTFEFVEE